MNSRHIQLLSNRRTLFSSLLSTNRCSIFRIIHLPSSLRRWKRTTNGETTSSAPFSTSIVLCKTPKKQGHDKLKLNAKVTADLSQLKSNVNTRKFAEDEDFKSELTADELAVKGANELEECYNLLIQNITKHLTINVNLKTYEDIPVTLENNETHKLFKLARITMRNPTTIAINFADNPTAIKNARIALQSIGDSTNVQQDGIMLYLPVPKITRERRQELANKVSASLLKEYKLVLSQIYSRYNKLLEKSTKNKDQLVKLSNGILKEMKNYVSKGEKKIAERKEALLSEVL